MRCAVQPGQQRADLPPPPEPRQVEMRTDNAQRSAVQQQFGKYGTARLECRQWYDLAMPDLDAPFHQQGIAMPTYALRAAANFDRPICPLLQL